MAMGEKTKRLSVQDRIDNAQREVICETREHLSKQLHGIISPYIASFKWARAPSADDNIAHQLEAVTSVLEGLQTRINSLSAKPVPAPLAIRTMLEIVLVLEGAVGPRYFEADTMATLREPMAALVAAYAKLPKPGGR